MFNKDTAKRPFWEISDEESLRVLETGKNGLTDAEAVRRREICGPNQLSPQSQLSWMSILLRQFKNPMLAILLIVCAITLLLGEWGDSVIICSTVLVNALLGFYQENKAENTLALLKLYVKDRARVRRAGRERRIDAADLVPGDIVRVGQGDRVPADARILYANDLQVDESILTGESLAVEKSADPLPADTRVSDRRCMIFCGTTVIQGFADAVLTITGEGTELNKIALLVQKTDKTETPLQKALSRFTIRASAVLGALTIALFVLGMVSGKSFYEMFLISVATGVSAVPEGLPVALTVILAVGADRLAKRKGIVRKLLAAETLGSTTIILTDKTGTLTEAKMELEKILPLDGVGVSAEQLRTRLLAFSLIHSDVVIENPDEPETQWKISGRPLEVALVKGAARLGVSRVRLEHEVPVFERLPFNSVNKFSGCLFGEGSHAVATFLGAPEALLSFSRLSDAERQGIAAQVDSLAYGGARVLAVSMVEVESPDIFDFAEARKKRSAKFLGLLAFRDPVRASAKDAIKSIGALGVRTVIVTGDHLGTAKTVAEALGFALGPHALLDGAEVDDLGDAGLRRRLTTASVIARTTPEQKLRIARLFRESGQVVAMTGDGVNDAPALREADIGIAVGSGSDVAKASADLVILDNDFATVAAAIVEGRKIIQNVRKVIVYLLSDGLDELLLIGGSLLFGLQLPINALQILWINLFSDSFPAIALAFESNIGDIGRAPVGFRHGLFDRELKFLVIGIGVLTSLLLFALYAVLLRAGFDPATVRTYIFASFGLYSLFLVFSIRSLRVSIFAYSLFSNPALIGSVAIGVILVGLAIYVPALQKLLGTVPLSLPWVIGVAAVGAMSIAIVETGKWLFRKKIL